MTREEAIARIEDHKIVHKMNEPRAIYISEALDMAIKALEQEDILGKIRAEILEEKECAYADFEQYKIDYLGVDAEYVEDELPQDDFRYGMERVIEIIDKYRME